MSIKNKVFFFSFTIAMVPFILILGITYYSMRQAIKNETLNELETLAEIQKERTIELINDYKSELAHFTKDSDFGITLNMYLTHNNSSYLGFLTKMLTDEKNDHQNINTVSILDIRGTVLASTDSVLVGKNFSKEEFFIKGIKKDDMSVFYKDPKKNNFLYIDGPLVYKQKIVGVVVIKSNLQKLFTLFNNQIGLEQTGNWGLAKKLPNGDALIVDTGRFDTNPDSPLETIVSKNRRNSPIIYAVSGNEKVYENLVDYRGNNVIAVTRYIPEEQWGLVVLQNRDEIFAPLYILFRDFLYFFVPLGVFLFFTIVILSRNITNPIERLSQSAKRLQEGDFTVKVQVTTKDELGRLASTFNTMVSQLKSLYSGLEEEVEQRTKDLSVKVADLEKAKKAMLNLLEDLQTQKKELQKRDEELLEAQHAGKFGSYTWNLQTNKITWSEEMYHLFNLPFTANPLTIAEILKRVYPDDLEKVKEATKVIVNPKEEFEIEFRIINPDKSIRWLRNRGKGKVGKGQLIETMGTFQDITKEKEIDRMKNEFISLASHQLRTPLTATKWFLEMLLSGDVGKLTEEQKQMASNINESNEHLIDLVNALLNVSRIDSGRLIINPVSTDVKEFIKGIEKEISVLAKGKEQSFIVKISDVPKITIDPKLIRQVYLNLLSNAVKYTPEKGKISLSVTKKGDELFSQISDNGYGIPAKDKNRVCQKFYRGDNIVKKVTEGTGLGLYLVKAIVEASGGKIWFESEEGKGTTFWFTIPLSGMKAKSGEVTIDS